MFPWRRKRATQYVQIVSEVLLQRTQADRVAAMLPDFIEEFPNWSTLSTATKADLRTHLKPLGLWRRRTISLLALADVASATNRFPEDRSKLEQLPAVGQYVASAILIFVHGKSEPLLDSNMARVIERYFGARELADIRFDPYLQKLSRRIVNVKQAAPLNWAILDLAALVCMPRKPRCEACPLAKGCKYRARNRLPSS